MHGEFDERMEDQMIIRPDYILIGLAIEWAYVGYILVSYLGR